MNKSDCPVCVARSLRWPSHNARAYTINVISLSFPFDHADGDLRSRYNRDRFVIVVRDRCGQRIRNHPRPHYVREYEMNPAFLPHRSLTIVISLKVSSDSRNQNNYREYISHNASLIAPLKKDALTRDIYPHVAIMMIHPAIPRRAQSDCVNESSLIGSPRKSALRSHALARFTRSGESTSRAVTFLRRWAQDRDLIAGSTIVSRREK